MSEREFDAYLKLLGGLLRLDAGQRERIAQELRDHMEDRLEALLAAGYSRDDAVAKALEEFGDAATLAGSFGQIAWNRKKRFIMRCTAASVCGVLAIILAAAAFWPGGQPGGAGIGPGQVQAQGQGETDQPARTLAQERADRNAATREKLAQYGEAQSNGIPLRTMMEIFKQEIGVPYYLDEEAMASVGTDGDTSLIELQLQNTRYDVLLNLMLEPLNCGYYLLDGMICITSREKAEARTELRVYDCAEILNAIRGASARRPASSGGGNSNSGAVSDVPNIGSMGSGGGNSVATKTAPPRYVTTSPNADVLIDIITGAVRPESWEANGGHGTISEYDGKLIVRQNEAGHSELEYLLARLRGAETPAGSTSPQ